MSVLNTIAKLFIPGFGLWTINQQMNKYPNRLPKNPPEPRMKI